MSPIPIAIPNDAEIDTARTALREWGRDHGYEDSFPDELLVMFFRSAAEKEGWQLRLCWLPATASYGGRWIFCGQPSDDLFCGRSLDETRLIGCAALIQATPSNSGQQPDAHKFTQPASKSAANSLRTD